MNGLRISLGRLAMALTEVAGARHNAPKWHEIGQPPANQADRMTASTSQLQPVIEKAWEARADLNPATKGAVRDAVETTLSLLDSGVLRVAEKTSGSKPGEGWIVHQWAKKAVLLSFRLQDNGVMPFGKGDSAYGYDKVPLKFADWNAGQFHSAGFRAVPGSVVRRSAFVARNVVLMPSFVNVGAYVDSGTMVDTWATVGSCAQIGKNVHLSGGVGIGGVLEPLQANPTIIEDNCFVGARSEVVEGVVVGEGSVISMGVFIGASTKVVDRQTGQIHVGKVPPYSVVVSGSLPGKNLPGENWGPSLYCAVIVKTVDAQTRSKTSINDLLRD
jgi:2,3,4,5-tetrahydropyridine-2-carboxylate N-succinyltransferase